MLRKKVSLILILFLSIGAFQLPAQGLKTDEKVARLLFERGEFDKAVVYYEKLFSDNPTEEFYLSYYSCLIRIKEFKTCEKLVKKQIKRQPDNLKLILDLGLCYKAAGDKEKSDKEFNKAIDKIGQNQQMVIGLAKNFMGLKMPEMAIKTYMKGRSIMGANYPFCFEIAEVYNNMGDTKNMIAEYLEAINFNEAYTSQVQNALQTEIGEDTKGEKTDLLKGELLKKIQQYPSKVSYIEMLIWLFVQHKNFDAAYDQTKALDKRLGANTGRVYNLATLCVANNDFETASKCYQYEIDKGRDNDYYQTARMEYVKAMNKRLLMNNSYTRNDLLQLRATYLRIIDEFGTNPGTVDLVNGLAHLYAFYLHMPDSAILILNKVVGMSGLEQHSIAEAKLELADVLLFTGELWEPSLLYSQVEKSFKHDVIGQEAKFRNAKLSYYQGDFEWAQGQLTVLKAATSKLIANDALDLSLLILENADDSIAVPLHIFSRADLLMFQNQDSLAMLTLDSISSLFPQTTLNDDILFRKYKVAMKYNKFSEAKDQLNKLLSKYSDDILADDALFSLAELEHYRFRNIEEAKKSYEKLIIDYPGSIYTVESRKRFRQLRGDKFN
jgi:tetratricopeptide (TPR) repeat protein